MTVVDNVENEGTAAPEGTPPPQADAGGDATPPAAVAGEVPPVAPPAPEYQPNYKYKVKDSELEFDEALRAAIKDKQTEEKLRDLYTRAHGLEDVKASKEQLSQRLSSFEQELSRAGQLVKSGREMVIKAAMKELEYAELPEDQKRLYDSKRQAENQLDERNSYAMAVEQQLSQVMVQARTTELNSVLARDEFKQVADAYDAKMGQPGAFKELVKEHGYLVATQFKKDISAEEAVAAVASRFKPFLAQGQPQATPQQTVIIQKDKPPVIPALGKGSGSPGKSAVRSIEDLKKLAKLNSQDD